MNWTQFSCSLIFVYVFYYLLNIAFDLMKRGRSKTTSNQNELVFSEEYQAKLVYPDQTSADSPPSSTEEITTRQAISSGMLQTTGGVSLKELFSLAQSNLIEYTKAIPY